MLLLQERGSLISVLIERYTLHLLKDVNRKNEETIQLFYAKPKITKKSQMGVMIFRKKNQSNE